MTGVTSGRKTLGLALAALVALAGLVGPVAVDGVGAAGNTLSVSDATVAGDDGGTVDVQAGHGDVESYEIALDYDPSVVTVDSVAGGPDTDPDSSIDDEAGRVTLTESNVGQLSDGTVARITFAAVGDGDATTTVGFAPDATELLGPQGEPLPVEDYESGTLTVDAGTPTATDTATQTASDETSTSDQSESTATDGSNDDSQGTADGDSDDSQSTADGDSEDETEGGTADGDSDGDAESNAAGDSNGDSGSDSGGGDGLDSLPPTATDSGGGSGLPFPGTDVGLAVLAVLLLIGGGGLGVVVVRQRRSRQSKLDW